MIFFFLPKSPETKDAAFQKIQIASEINLFSYKDKKNFNPIQVQAQVPYWIKKTQPLMVSFLQSYYDWLAQGYGYSGINMMDLKNIMDISETPDFALKNFIMTYAPSIKGIYDLDENEMPSPDNIRKTITNIRQEIYQRKSNEDAFKSLMASLFSVNPDTIHFSYPKRKIMRLNGGMVEWMSNSNYYGLTGEYSEDRYTMVGSHLNQGVFPDHGIWQDFSYLMTTEIDNPYYEFVVKETLHPAGLLGSYEIVEQYSEEGYVEQESAIYEPLKVRNYWKYSLDSSESLSPCTGCTGTINAPTFQYPKGLTKPFSKIKVSDVIYYTGGNDNIGDDCTFACGTSGEVDYAWYIDSNSYTNSLLTPEVLFDPEEDGRFGIGGP